MDRWKFDSRRRAYRLNSTKNRFIWLVWDIETQSTPWFYTYNEFESFILIYCKVFCKFSITMVYTLHRYYRCWYIMYIVHDLCSVGTYSNDFKHRSAIVYRKPKPPIVERKGLPTQIIIWCCKPKYFEGEDSVPTGNLLVFRKEFCVLGVFLSHYLIALSLHLLFLFWDFFLLRQG